MSGQKHDQAKPRFSLIPNGTLMPVVRVLEMGARKYAVENWKHVPDARTRYFDALHRHVDAWQQGERFDSESGESHLAHAICCLMFMMWLDQNECERPEAIENYQPNYQGAVSD